MLEKRTNEGRLPLFKELSSCEFLDMGLEFCMKINMQNAQSIGKLTCKMPKVEEIKISLFFFHVYMMPFYSVPSLISLKDGIVFCAIVCYWDPRLAFFYM